MSSVSSSLAGFPSGIPPPPPGFDGTFDQAVGIAWVSIFVAVASAALLVYDVFLTLEREIRLVWLYGRWGLPTFLYLLNRYGTMIQACLTLVLAFDYDFDMPSCYRWNVFLNWCIPLVMAWVEATLTLRVLAMYGNNLKLVVCLWAWYLINVAAMFTMMGLTLQGTAPMASPAPPILGCRLSGPFSYLWQVYLPSLVFETTVAALTLWKAIEHKQLWSSPIFFVLIRDGFFYFFVAFALMLVNMVIALTANALYTDWTPQISMALASIVAVRLFLNLRELARPQASTTADGNSDPNLELSAISNPASTPWTTQDSA